MRNLKNVLISLIICLSCTTLFAEEHPYIPLIKIAQDSLDYIDREVRDYSAVLIKKDAAYGNQELFIKVRHNPYSVYVKFLSPNREAGKEAVFKDGQIRAHGVGVQRILGTLNLRPTSPLAMAGQRYPITDLGLRRIAERVIETGDREKSYSECVVNIENTDSGTCYIIEHPEPRKQFFFHVAKIFVKDNLPVRTQIFDWNKVLVEDYTYTEIKINQGFTDKDFDTREYGF